MGEAALREDALQHEFPLLGWSGGEKGPDMRDALFIILGEHFEFLWKASALVSRSMFPSDLYYPLQLIHRGFIDLSPTFQARSMPVAVTFFRVVGLGWSDFVLFAPSFNKSVLSREMLGQIGCDGLLCQLWVG